MLLNCRPVTRMIHISWVHFIKMIYSFSAQFRMRISTSIESFMAPFDYRRGKATSATVIMIAKVNIMVVRCMAEISFIVMK